MGRSYDDCALAKDSRSSKRSEEGAEHEFGPIELGQYFFKGFKVKQHVHLAVNHLNACPDSLSAHIRRPHHDTIDDKAPRSHPGLITRQALSGAMRRQ